MRKKLIVSFLTATLILLYLSPAASAAGSASLPSKISYKTSTPQSGSVFSGKTVTPSDNFKLERFDFPLISEEGTECKVSEASTDNVIYSPDLPEPATVPEEDACEEPNFYLALEMELVKKVNEARAAAGQHELIYCEELSEFARQHSEDMSTNHYFSHNSPTCGSYVKRLYASGINYISSGENLARFECIEKAHEALLDSFGHKQNMLSPKYTHIGIGITWDEKLEVYCITQWFAKFYD